MDNGPKKYMRKLTTEFLLLFYEAHLREHILKKIAAGLNINTQKYTAILERFPELREAKDLAEQRRKETASLSGYVFKHLSPEVKKIWDDIQFWESSDSVNSKIDKILNGHSSKIRQEIFIHALIHYSYNISEACRVASINRGTLDKWKKEDLHFSQLIEEMDWHKKNFFEHALVDLVQTGNPGAVIFVNRTKNADRGYSEKLRVEHSGSVSVGISVDELNLSLETRKEILKAIRAKKEDNKVQEAKQLEQGKVIEV